jgi:hypothetical protein
MMAPLVGVVVVGSSAPAHRAKSMHADSPALRDRRTAAAQAHRGKILVTDADLDLKKAVRVEVGAVDVDAPVHKVKTLGGDQDHRAGISTIAAALVMGEEGVVIIGGSKIIV